MTTLVRWEPVTRPRPFFRAFDRFFDDPFWPSPTVKSVNGGPRTPALDMYEADEEVVVRTALPGVTPEDVQITIEDGYLEIRAQISSEVVDEKARWVRRELLSGDYGRKVALPTGVWSMTARRPAMTTASSPCAFPRPNQPGPSKSRSALKASKAHHLTGATSL